jgi:membrane protease YdiL (CAAX protease family)
LTKRHIAIAYCVGIFVASWASQLAGIHAVRGDLENGAITPWLIVAMITPALGVLLLMAFSRPVREQVLWKANWRAFAFAPYCVLIPTLVSFGMIAVFSWMGWGRSAWFEFSPAGVQVLAGRWLLGRGTQSWPLFFCNIATTATAYSLVAMILGAGEELGWRGYLQGRLIEHFGLSRGIIVLGLLWSFWHLPLLLAGYNYPQHPVLGAFVLSPLLLVAASFFMAWLTLRTQSFWPAALAHGAGDSIQGGLTSSIRTSLPGLYLYLTELTLIMIVGLIFFVLLNRQSRFPNKLRRAMDIHLLGDVSN